MTCEWECALQEEAGFGAFPVLARIPDACDLPLHRPRDLVKVLRLQLRSPHDEEHLGAELVVEPGHDVTVVVQGEPPLGQVFHVQH